MILHKKSDCTSEIKKIEQSICFKLNAGVLEI